MTDASNSKSLHPRPLSSPSLLDRKSQLMTPTVLLPITTDDASNPKSPDPRPLNILSLDGGGNRGYSELLILDHIMKQYEEVTQSNSVPLPCEVFDLICGTSTGGLIALMLGRLRMSVEDAIRSYEDFSKTIFGDKGRALTLIRAVSGRPLYNAKTLEESFKKVVSENDKTSVSNLAKTSVSNLAKTSVSNLAKISALNISKNKALKDDETNVPLRDPLGDNKLCRTFVVAVPAAAEGSPQLLRTYGTPNNDPDACEVWEAARATTAASAFFEPVIIGMPPQKYYDDSSSEANNPSELALREIEQIFPGRQIGCFLSLGFGPPVADSDRKLYINCEAVDERVHREMREGGSWQYLPDAYFRFSVDNPPPKDIHIDEWNHPRETTTITEAYLFRSRPKNAVGKCVEKLKGSRTNKGNSNEAGKPKEIYRLGGPDS